MPKGYMSVEKRSLMKLVRKMNKKKIKGEHIFMMKDSDVVTAQDFIQFIDKTLRLSLKKREIHALINLCDTNKNNTIAKEEFLELIKKGERLLEAHPKPIINNYFETAENEKDNKSRSSKPILNRYDTSVAYSGDAKAQMLKIITASIYLSIEEYFSRECQWKDTDNILFPDFKSKCDKQFDIPANDLKELFDECDLFKKNQIKVNNLATTLKSIIKKADDESSSLLLVSDIIRDHATMTPRSGTSLLVEKVNDECEQQGTTPDAIFKAAKQSGKVTAERDSLMDSFRICLPKLSRELILKVLLGFKTDKISYNEFLIYFNVKDIRKPKTDDARAKAREKWITKYTKTLELYGLDPITLLKEADKNKDGILQLQELDKAIKLYIKEKDLSYTDLQNILDCLDSNNDGTVTTDEYKSAMIEYGVKVKPPMKVDKKEEEQKIVNKTGEAIAAEISTKIRQKYKTKLDQALDTFNEENDVDIGKKAKAQKFSLQSLKIAFVDENKFITAEEAKILYDKIQENSTSKMNNINGEELYNFLVENTDPNEISNKQEVKQIIKPNKEEPKKTSVTAKLEGATKEHLPVIYRKFKSSKIMQPKHLKTYLEVYWNDQN